MILVLGVWAFVRALLVNSAAVSLEMSPSGIRPFPRATPGAPARPTR